MRLAAAIAALSVPVGCAHAPAPDAPAAPGLTLRPVPWSALAPDDDLPLAPLADAASRQADLVLSSPRVGALRFGERLLSREDYAAALRRFAVLARAAATGAALRAAVEAEFDAYEAVFPQPVLVTAYYEPVIRGAARPGGRFTQALYRSPVERYDDRHPGPTRADIDSGGALAGRGLELCFVDPLDAFVLQTEGSGVVALDVGGELALDFAATNARPHVRLAPLLAAHIPAERMNMHTIEAHMRGLPERQMRDVLEKNPRYVFFQPRPVATGSAPRGPATSIGLPAVDGRVIATDPRWVPKGGLAFLVTERPEFAAPTDQLPVRHVPFGRFVLDADTGGGIKGARVDLYWGRGDEARLFAGAMKRRGRLFYLAPRR